MKIALCFIISYDHILNKENIWRKWIEYNKDIINVYFYYKDKKKIRSKWILDHTIPQEFIRETSYYYVIPAYMSLMNYAYHHDDYKNQWFCFLTDSCCPIIPPNKFRYLFYNYYNKSIFSWKKSWWNVQFHKRGNLALLPQELHLANDPWFVLKRENVYHCISFINNPMFKKVFEIICRGGLANESLFVVILYLSKQLDNCICKISHIADWSRMASPTSPHIFKYDSNDNNNNDNHNNNDNNNNNEKDIQFIEKSLKKEKFVMFIRKVSQYFPDNIIEKYISPTFFKGEIFNLSTIFIFWKNYSRIKRTIIILFILSVFVSIFLSVSLFWLHFLKMN